MNRRFPALLAAASLTIAACSAPATSGRAPAPEAPAGLAGITPEDFYARVSFLASDALQGRDTPSAGLNAAAAYLVSEYLRFGLDPAGEDGGFYQWYPFSGRGGPAAGAGDALAPNVAAVVRGSDPALRDEYVVLSAHMDHVGFGPPVNGDSLYNGADDNASGTTALVEIAEALASAPDRPARSVVFLHVSGEEHGLLGSRWYSDHPTVPLEQIVANINIDMIARNAPDSVVVIGKDYSSLGTVVDEVGARHPEFGLVVSDDIWPEERFFFRSDHFNFARKEIPSIFFFSGVHEDYHQPSDEVDTLDVDKAARVTRMVLQTVRDIANDPERPTWNPEGLAEVRALTR